MVYNKTFASLFKSLPWLLSMFIAKVMKNLPQQRPLLTGRVSSGAAVSGGCGEGWMNRMHVFKKLTFGEQKNNNNT